MKIDLYKPVIIETNTSYECVLLDTDEINVYINWLKPSKGAYKPCKIIKSKVYGNIVQVNSKKEAKEQLKNAEANFVTVNGKDALTPTQLIKQMDEIMNTVHAVTDDGLMISENPIVWYETYDNFLLLIENFFNNSISEIRTLEFYAFSVELANQEQKIIDYNNDIVPLKITVRNFAGEPIKVTIMENYTLRQTLEMFKRLSSSRVSSIFMLELLDEWYIQKEYCTNDFIFDFSMLLLSSSKRIFDLQFATLLNTNAYQITQGVTLPKEVANMMHRNNNNYIYATRIETEIGSDVLWLYITTKNNVITEMLSGSIPTKEPIHGSFYYLEGTKEHKQFYNQLMKDIEIAKNKKEL